MEESFTDAKLFSDLTVFSFIRIISKKFVEELYPLSCDLQVDFSINPDLE